MISISTNKSTLKIFFRALRKCGKKMPRYCDVNNDKKITLSEWLNCLNAHGSAKDTTKTSISEYTIEEYTEKIV